MSKSLKIESDSVDGVSDPHDFLRYLDMTRATDFFQKIKPHTFARMELQGLARGRMLVSSIGISELQWC